MELEEGPIEKNIEGKISYYNITEGPSWTRYDIIVENETEKVKLCTFNGILGKPFKEGDEVVVDYVIKHNGRFVNYNIQRIVLKKEHHTPESVLSKETLEKLRIIGEKMDKYHTNCSDERVYNEVKDEWDKVRNKI